MNQSHIVVVILLISVFTFVVAVSSLYVQSEISSGHACGCFIPISLFIPFLASIGLFIGTLVFYLLMPNSMKLNKKVVLRFLEPSERAICNIVIDRDEVSQAMLTRLSGMNKVKVFRVIERLVSRGILVKEKHGKVNMIHLNKDIKRQIQ